MPRFKLRPYQKPRLAVRVTIGVAGTLTTNFQTAPTPVWYAAPSFTVVAGQTSQWFPLNVYALGNNITVGWHSSNTPSLQPTWVEFQNGPSPQIRFLSTVQDANDMSSFVLMATASGQTVLSSTVGAGSLTVLPTSDWIVSVASFTQGTPGQVQLVKPVNTADGGTFHIDSGSLSGVSLTEDGLLQYDGAAAGGQATLIFSYVEPYALPTLTLHPTQTAVLPYMATVYPQEGVVPSGRFLVSPDDTSLRSSTLSTWEDGSAKVMVVAGHTQVTASIQTPVRLRLNRSTDTAGTALTTAHIDNLLTSVGCNFGTPQTLTNFTSGQDFVWWANSQVICARYRLATGLGSVEVLFDIHAFANGRVFVEAVVENSRMSSTTPVKPSAASYTGSVTVSVNGSTIGTASNPITGSYGGLSTYVAQTHEAFRAWYCSGWVGGDPGTDVTHDTTSMQLHPLLFKIARPSNQNMTTLYGSDVYAPWSYGRQRGAYMGAGGDHASIGALTKWDTQYLQTGDKNARKASIVNALACLSYGINYRDSGTNLVPTFAQVGSKSRNASTWPETSSEPCWEVAHHPAEGLMAFLCRPSPCFIELAQKIACWNGSWVADGQFHQYFQTRGRAWCMRSLGHALFLTPTTISGTPGINMTAWRTAAQASVASNVTNQLDVFRTASNNPLGVVWDGRPDNCLDHSETTVGFQQSIWQHHFLMNEVHKLAQAKLLTGTAQTALATFADWACQVPIRYVNESTAGEWRYIRHKTTIGRQNYDSTNGGAWGGGIYTGSTPDSLPNWGQQFAWFMTDSVPALSGVWMQNQNSGYERTYADVAFQIDAVANNSLNYVTHFWSALCMAVERGVTGADAAWTKVNTNVTNLSTWLDGFATDPRQGLYPRNK